MKRENPIKTKLVLIAALALILISTVIQTNTLFAQDKTLVTVAADGSGDFITIQSAIDATKAFPDERMTIFIKNGTYREKVHVFSWNNRLSLIGESVEHTIIMYNDFFGKINRGRNSTFHTATVLVQGNDFIAENISFVNDAGPVGQALALAVEADRCVFRNCRILGHQDALYAAGEGSRQYYFECYIEGTTDFIFGEATALFEKCTIKSLSNSYITAASTPLGAKFGYVFIECNLVAANQGVDNVYLGRPWRDHAQTVFIGCNMGAHIKPEGWHPWNANSGRDKTAFYAEYNNQGPGADTQKRVAWGKQLTKKQARKYNKNNILGSEPNTDYGIWYAF